MKKSDSAIHRAVSLFSNCGAGDVGYRRAGFRFEVMAEKEESRLEVCLLNHPEADGVPGDLRYTWVRTIGIYRKRAGISVAPDLLCACPPCQGMSSARGKRGDGDNPDHGMWDDRNLLVEVVHNTARALKPRVIVVENVPAFLTRKVKHPDTGVAISAAKLLITRLEAEYQAFPILVDLADYGVPQSRKRAFVTFVRRSEPGLNRLLKRGVVPYPIPLHAPDHGGKARVSLEKALAEMGLPKLDACSEEEATSEVGGGMHSVPVWKDRRYDMVAAIPPGSGGSAWENDKCISCEARVESEDAAVCPNCGAALLRPVVEEDGGYRLIKGFRSSSYRRMRPGEPAATITTATGHVGSHFTIHPFENRLFSPLECALLQTFPRGFKWGDALKKYGPTNVRGMIGEAVPPAFTELHGEVLVKVLRDSWRGTLLRADDRRCTRAWKNLGLSPKDVGSDFFEE